MTRLRSLAAITTILSIALVSCGGSSGTKEEEALHPASGARSGVIAITQILSGARTGANRSAALLGIFVTEYLSIAPAAMAAEGALHGIGAQMQIAIAQNTVQDPDFDLLQAFADALQVDVADLLNRSPDRQESLDTYTEALNNVAERANDRYKELTATLEELKVELRTESKARSDAERELNKALRDKDFAAAGEQQKAVNDAQAAYSETDLQRKQVESLVETLDDLLMLYGEKILAIQSNREILIAGTKVVDVPGIDDLQIITRNKKSGSSGGKDRQFDFLFEGL